MKRTILRVALLVVTMLAGCEVDDQTGQSTQEEEQRIRFRGHVGLPPGLEELFAYQANIFFNESQEADRAVFAAELHGRLVAGENLYVVDLRSQASYQQGHIPQAINVPIEILFTEAARVPFPDDGTPIVFVCANGHVSAMAAALYGTMGYNAYSLRFGMISWRRSTPIQVHSSGQTPQAINGFNGPIAM